MKQFMFDVLEMIWNTLLLPQLQKQSTIMVTNSAALHFVPSQQTQAPRSQQSHAQQVEIFYYDICIIDYNMSRHFTGTR